MTSPQRCIEISKAHTYLGIARTTFEKHVRPNIPVTQLGHRAKLVELADLDNWWESYKSRVSEVDTRSAKDRQQRLHHENQHSDNKKLLQGERHYRSRTVIDEPSTLLEFASRSKWRSW